MTAAVADAAANGLTTAGEDIVCRLARTPSPSSWASSCRALLSRPGGAPRRAASSEEAACLLGPPTGGAPAASPGEEMLPGPGACVDMTKPACLVGGPLAWVTGRGTEWPRRICFSCAPSLSGWGGKAGGERSSWGGGSVPGINDLAGEGMIVMKGELGGMVEGELGSTGVR